ncbi:unnamed protein product [Toxocara canis]|uniref:SCP domain-containing protein n=1 Tax=Toxocara canis TaxID=6265 RepID=A0A183U245_TOXCA|nr:unnamed protein product [Toxocara canis]
MMNSPISNHLRIMNMLLLAVLLLATTSIASGIECPNVANPVLNATIRAAVVAKHNELRATLTHGTAEYKGGHKLPSGKNIYQMVWDCDLEKHAQDWSNKCEFKHSDADMGENLFQSSPLSVGMLPFDITIQG